MPKITKTYDPSCYELAEHFLQDEPCRNDPDLYKRYCHDLASAIQDAVEFWFVEPPADGASLKKTDDALPSAADVRGILR